MPSRACGLSRIACEPHVCELVVRAGRLIPRIAELRGEAEALNIRAIEMKKAFGVDNVTPRQTFEDGRSPTNQFNSLPFNASDTIQDLKNIVEQHKTMSEELQYEMRVAEGYKRG